MITVTINKINDNTIINAGIQAWINCEEMHEVSSDWIIVRSEIVNSIAEDYSECLKQYIANNKITCPNHPYANQTILVTAKMRQGFIAEFSSICCEDFDRMIQFPRSWNELMK